MSCFVNGKGYGWDSLRISFLGNPDVIGVTSLNTRKRKKKQTCTVPAIAQ